MKNYDWKKELKAQKLMLEQKGYEVLMLAVYGSQNYNLDEYSDKYRSDFDTKAVVLPTLRDLIKGTKVSEVLDTEVGQCEVKDVRLFFEVLVKGNPAHLEVMVTDYQLVNERYKDLWTWTDENFEEFFRAVYPSFAKASYGMALQKQKALTHPYPSVAEKVEKYGYDGKQAHHVLRLLDLYTKTKEGVSFKEAMRYTELNKRGVLMSLKTEHLLTVEEVKDLVSGYVKSFKSLVDAEMNKGYRPNHKMLERVRTMGEEMVTRAVKHEVGMARVAKVVYEGE